MRQRKTDRASERQGGRRRWPHRDRQRRRNSGARRIAARAQTTGTPRRSSATWVSGTRNVLSVLGWFLDVIDNVNFHDALLCFHSQTQLVEYLKHRGPVGDSG